jgi:multidrug efflux system outer membrane protein
VAATAGGGALWWYRPECVWRSRDCLTNENLYAQQFEHLDNSLREYTESVRIATIKYKAGAYDMQQVLQLQTAQLSVESDVIKVRNARIANRINLHLALGASFEAASAVR